ncbi:MAG: hypothetical protein R6W99_02700 [Clostridia bacterium]
MEIKKTRIVRILILVSILAFVITGCGNGKALEWNFTFEQDEEGWTGDFTDLPVDYEQGLYELDFGYRDLPAELGVSKKAIMIGGNNSSDDLFMYIKRPLTKEDGVAPNTEYLVWFTVQIATNAPKGAFGIGGPPGEAVFFKVGASTEEPVPVIGGGTGSPAQYLLSADKGSQNDEGADAVLIGDVSKDDGSDDFNYSFKTLTNTGHPLKAVSDENGTLWIFLGTDSGFEGRTTLYYNSIAISLEKAN